MRGAFLLALVAASLVVGTHAADKKKDLPSSMKIDTNAAQQAALVSVQKKVSHMDGGSKIDYRDPVNPSYTWEATNPFVVYVKCDKNRNDESLAAGNTYSSVIVVKNAKPAAWVEVAFARNRGDAAWEPTGDCKMTSGLGSIPARTVRHEVSKGGSDSEHWNGASGSSNLRVFRARSDEQGFVKFRHYVESCDTFFYQAISDVNGEHCTISEAVPANNNFMTPESMDLWEIDNNANAAAWEDQVFFRDPTTGETAVYNGESLGDVVDATIAKFFHMTGVTTGLDVQMRFASTNNGNYCSGNMCYKSNQFYSEIHNKAFKGFLPRLKVEFTVPMQAEITMRRNKCCSNGMRVVFAHAEKLPSDVFVGSYNLAQYDYEHFGSLVDFYQCCSGSVLRSSFKPGDKPKLEKGVVNTNTNWYATNAFNDYGSHDFTKDEKTKNDGDDYTMVPNGRHTCSYEDSKTSDRYEDMRYKVTIPGDGSPVMMKIREPQGKEEFHDSVFRTTGTRPSDSAGDYGSWWSDSQVEDTRFVPNPFVKGDSVYIHVHGGWAESQAVQLYYADETTDDAIQSRTFTNKNVPEDIMKGTKMITRGDDFDHNNMMQNVWDDAAGSYVEVDYDENDENKRGFFDYDRDMRPDSGNIMVGLTGENLSDQDFA